MRAKSLWFALLFAGFLSVMSCNAEQMRGTYISLPNVEKQVEEILSKMTLDEKIIILHGNSTFWVGGVKRLGIPEMALSDGPHGVKQEVSRHSWISANQDDDYVTSMPAGATKLTLPDNESIKIFAVTVAKNEDDSAEAAQPLYDDFTGRKLSLRVFVDAVVIKK